MRAPLTSLLLAAAVALAACGDDEPSIATQPEGGGGLAARPADQILGQAAQALGKLRSYRIEGRQVDEDGPLQLAADVSAAGDASMRFEQRGQRVEVRVTRRAAFLRANDAFWERQGGGGAAAKLLAGRWVKAPNLDALGLREAVEDVRPRTLAYCLRRGTGKVTKKGTGEVGGRPAVILRDDGRTPGGAPGEMYIATTGPALPLRVTQTGPNRPGKMDPRCGDEDTTTKESDLRLSRFDEPVRVTPPADAVDLDELARRQQDEQVN